MALLNTLKSIRFYILSQDFVVLVILWSKVSPKSKCFPDVCVAPKAIEIHIKHNVYHSSRELDPLKVNFFTRVNTRILSLSQIEVFPFMIGFPWGRRSSATLLSIDS